MAVLLLQEGLGVGVTFGALSSAHRDLPRSDHASYDHKLTAARSLTIAIGLQDIVGQKQTDSSRTAGLVQLAGWLPARIKRAEDASS